MKWSRYFPLYALLAPTFVLLLLFNYYPALLAVVRSFFEWDIGDQATFVGLANFRELFQDEIFLTSMVNIAGLTAFAILVNLTVPLFVAEMIFSMRSARLAHFWRIVFLLPMLVPPIVIWILWKFIYSDAGLLTTALEAFGMQEWIYGWLSHPATALPAVAFVGFPFAYGFNILIYYAGLSNIPRAQMEAARLEGATRWQTFLYVHLPGLLGQVKLLLVLTLINTVQGFESVYVLTGDGGPGYATMLPGLYMFFNGFTYKRMGYACAIGVVLFVVMLGFTVLNQRYLRVRGGV